MGEKWRAGKETKDNEPAIDSEMAIVNCSPSYEKISKNSSTLSQQDLEPHFIPR